MMTLVNGVGKGVTVDVGNIHVSGRPLGVWSLLEGLQ